MAYDLQRLKAASNAIAVVGVGETDYASDYPASRSGKPTTDHFGFGIRAFKAALNDAGLRREDVDGIIACSLPLGRLVELLGMEPRFSASSFDPATAFMVAIDAIRCCQVARDRGVGGPLFSIAAYTMKHPPRQIPDDIARDRVEKFISGELER